MIPLRPNIAQMLLTMAYEPFTQPAFSLGVLSATIEKMFVRDPEKAARMIGTLAGNALRINMREGRRVIL